MGRYFFALALAISLAASASAQCTMCKSAAESNEKQNKGLNTGIVYLLAMPYVLISTVGYFWFKNRRELAEQEDAQELRRLLFQNKPPQ